MKVAELLASRKANWQALEQFCNMLETRRRSTLPAQSLARFASLYRATCADLALSEAYQLPPGTVDYLHQLVGRAHNQLYRSRTFDVRSWGRMFLVDLPRRLCRNRPLMLTTALFWGLFFLSMFLASDLGTAFVPGYAEKLVGAEQLASLEEMHANSVGGRDLEASALMGGFYIQHNAGIGLRCFAAGLLFGIGGLFETIFNAASIGAMFGYMTHPGRAGTFFQFVTAHGPFELTAIVLSAAAGMEMGFALIYTGGLTRADSLRRAAKNAIPVAVLGVVLFALAAFIEGFISPSALPYGFKVLIAAGSTCLLIVYFVILGRLDFDVRPT